MATYNITTTIPTKLVAGDILECPYSGSAVTLDLPKGTYKLECWGAQGGSYNASYAAGGLGGYSTGVLKLKKRSTTVYLYAGGQGSAYTTSTDTSQGGGGFNGGGGAGYRGGGGGGASDIRIGTDSLYARVLVAGGGGGAYAYNTIYKAAGGAGGGESGTAGSYYSSGSSYVGGAATQTAGGAAGSANSANYYGKAGTFGVGGSTGYKYNSTSYYSSGAGGGGWYGGGGAGNYNFLSRNYAAGGGGGSGYVYTSSTASNYPTGCLLDSSYYLTDASTTAGTTSGNGSVRITVIKITSSGHIKLGDTWKRISAAYKKVTVPYTRLEYIESTGTQCIDTGVVAKSGLSMVASFELTSTKESAIAGAYGNSSRFYPLMVNGVSLLYGYGALNTISGISAEIGKKYNVESSLLTGSQTVKVNGETVASASSANNYNTGKTLLLFANNFGDSVSAAIDFAELKLFGCQLYENGTLVRDFVPCKSASGEAGLYDLVNRVFYTNAGTGTFIAGPTVANSTASVWQELEDVKSLFFGGTVEKKYVDYSSPEMADTTFLAINGLNDIQKANGYSGSIVTNSGVIESTDVPSNTSFTKSLYFDGNSFITFTNYDFAANDFTIEWWEKPTSDTAGTRFMSTYGTGGGTEAGVMLGWWCTTDLIPEIKWTSYDSYSSWNVIGHGVSAGNTDTNSWHHMAYVRSGSNLYVVKDGELLSTQNIGTNEIGCNMSLPMCFGRRGSDTPNGTCYSGYLCGIRLSKSALYTKFGTYEEDVPLDEIPKYGYRAVYNKYEVAELLPSGYTPVEYIESSGTQYIDTGFKPDQNTRVVIDIEATKMASINFVAFGCRVASTNNDYSLWYEYTDKTKMYSNYGNSTATLIVANSLSRLTIDKNKNATTINGVTAQSTANSFAKTLNLFLLSLNANGSEDTTRRISAKLYSCKIYDNGTLVRDFLPCINASGTIGLYDLVNSTFYSNADSGTFTAGSEVENAIAGEFIEQVIVNNSTTYPDGGVLDGYYYIKVL